MEKYELIPTQLLYEGTLREENFFAPHPLEDEALLLAHDADYLQKCRTGTLTHKEMRRIGFPYAPALMEREEAIMAGTVQAALYALDHGVAFNVAGGTHHAFRDHGEGFCIFNDLAIAALYLIAKGKAKRVLIIDLDVHQGNGTAAICGGREDVFTFSMHGQNNYPLQKEKSHLDIPLPDGTTDGEYLCILAETLSKLVDSFLPDFILYQSGVDILATDKLGKMALTKSGCKERDFLVLSLAKAKSIPLTAAMGGGYSPYVRDIVETHCNLFRVALELHG